MGYSKQKDKGLVSSNKFQGSLIFQIILFDPSSHQKMKIYQEDWTNHHLLTNCSKLGFWIKAVYLQLFGPNLFSKVSICSQVSKDGILPIGSLQRVFNWSVDWKPIRLGKVNCTEEKVNSWLFRVKIMFLMSNIFNGENLIKKFQGIHQKSRNA